MTEPSQYFKGRTVQEQMNEVIGYVDTRAAEVATAAIASDVAQVHQDMLDADADAAAAAASAAAAAGTLANAVKKTGEASQSIEGDVLLTSGDLGVAGDLGVTGNLGVTGSATVPTPVNNTEAANKKYVDDADALKADKTYVDAQDALKIDITNINSYAVGLTGNQYNIGGSKRFQNVEIAGNTALVDRPTGIVQNQTGTNQQVQYLRTLVPDNNNNEKELFFIQVIDGSDGTRSLRLNLFSSNGTRVILPLMTIAADGTPTYPW